MDKYNDSNSYYVKNNVEHNEYFMHQYVYNLKIVNKIKIIEYNKNKKILVMDKVSNNNLSDNYGEEASDVPDNIFNEVVNTLLVNGVERCLLTYLVTYYLSRFVKVCPIVVEVSGIFCQVVIHTYISIDGKGSCKSWTQIGNKTP